MKRAIVYFRSAKAGVLTEDESGYTFEYELTIWTRMMPRR